MNTNKKYWTPEDKARFTEMCLAGKSNKEIADAFGCRIFAVQHKRSTWGLTIAKCEAMKAAAGKEPIDDIPSPVKPILSTRSAKAPEEQTPADEEEKIEISAEAFFALAHELSENAEKMEKLSADNLTLKEQLLNQSQLIAQLQDALEIEQAASTAHTSKLELIGQAAAILVMEFEKMERFLGRSGLYRLFHRYKSLTQRAKDSLKAAEEAIEKEAENAGND